MASDPLIPPPPGTGVVKETRTTLEPAMYEKLYGLVAMGNYLDVACSAAGVSENTYIRWMRAGRESLEWLESQGIEPSDVMARFDGDVARNLLQPPDGWQDRQWRAAVFVIGMTKANAEAEAYAVGIVRKHMPDQWTAAMTFLERKAPKRWRRRDIHEHVEVAGGNESKDVLDNPAAVKLMHEALERAAITVEAEELE
jgi:hypothetical protein